MSSVADLTALSLDDHHPRGEAAFCSVAKPRLEGFLRDGGEADHPEQRAPETGDALEVQRPARPQLLDRAEDQGLTDARQPAQRYDQLGWLPGLQPPHDAWR